MIKDQELREYYIHLIELGIRLKCKTVTTCSAIIFFYKISIKHPEKIKGSDKYQIARACICAAGVRENDISKTNASDVINVSNNILNPNSLVLNIDDERKAKRLEVFDEIRKILAGPSWQFTGTPKVYSMLINYLSLLRDWQPGLFLQYEMEQLCTMVLQDMYVCPSFIWASTPEIVASLAIHFVLKLISSDIKTESFLHSVCPRVSKSSFSRYRTFVKEQVYML